MTIALALVLGVMLDRLLGEPPLRIHPLVGFGLLAGAIEKRFNNGDDRPRRLLGGLAVVILVGLPAWLLWWALPTTGTAATLVGAAVLYLTIGGRSLADHARAVMAALGAHDVPAARHAVAMIVSRDCHNLSAEEVAGASIESVVENGCDAIFGAMFWFVVAGPAAALAYRLSNTLDAMWGYRTSRYGAFGWAAARLDDVLNWIPARLTALSYAALGHTREALTAWRLQGRHWKSPNAGPVMAAAAGALGIRLGGEATYHGVAVQRPPLGTGRAPRADDILRAVDLVQRTEALWVVGVVGLILSFKF